MRKAKFVVERTGDNFENEVINLITDKYNLTEKEAKLAFQNCMCADYAVLLPISPLHPEGVMIATDVYRQKVAIG